MDPRMTPLFRLADEIARLRRRLACADGSDLEGPLKLGLAQMQRSRDGLIHDTEGWIEIMPWWTEWSRRGRS
jgi:hypothetical protein